VTKSGGFGDPTTLTTIVARLRSGAGRHDGPPPLPPLQTSTGRTIP
jgi:hypothetical protein